MNYADAHDDHTRNATIQQVIDYLEDLVLTNDDQIIEAYLHYAADDLARDLKIALKDLNALRNALARIDARNTNN